MPKDFTSKSVTLPDDLVNDCQNIYDKNFRKPHEKDNFSEVVRVAMNLFVETNSERQ